MRYLNRERLHKAQFLLVHSPMILKEVAAVCGFSSAHYFSRVFRAQFGCAPRQWRRNAQGRKATVRKEG